MHLPTADRWLMGLLRQRALFLFGDASVWARYRWVERFIPATRDHRRLLDVGCGNGGFTILARGRGYDAIGLTWDKEATEKATARSEHLGLNAKFMQFDARNLDSFEEGRFHCILCLENIEHILDDEKLFAAMSARLMPLGILVLTAPYQFYRAMSADDSGPFDKPMEDGSHVRRGYTVAMLRGLADRNGLDIETVEYCGGYFCCRIVALQRLLGPRVSERLISALLIPFKILADACDRLSGLNSHRLSVSICAVYQKPRADHVPSSATATTEAVN